MKLLIVGDFSMKLTKSLLLKLINEALDHPNSCSKAHPNISHDKWKERKELKESEDYDERDPQQKHDLGPGGWERLAYTEKSYSLKDELKHILRKWENTEYDSDEHRWKEYAADIQNLIAEPESEEEPLSLGTPKRDPLKKLKPQSMGGPLEET